MLKDKARFKLRLVTLPDSKAGLISVNLSTTRFSFAGFVIHPIRKENEVK